MNTLVSDIMGECESIISEVENTLEELQSNGSTFDDELNTIRYSAEELQEIVVGSTIFSTDSNDIEIDSNTLEEMKEQSITLYQDCKYILEYLETEHFYIITDEVSKSFGYIRDAVNTIRNILDKE